MRKYIISGIILMACLAVYAVDKPTISYTKTSPSGGIEQREKIVDSLDSVKTAVDAVITNQETLEDTVAPTFVIGITNAARVGTVTINTGIEEERVYYSWLSATAGAASEGTNLTSITASTGTVIEGGGSTEPVVVFKTATNGVAVLVVTVGADVDRFLNVAAPSGEVTSSGKLELAN